MPLPPPPASRTLRVQKAGTVCVSEIEYAAGERQPRHAHGQDTVTILLAGALRERVGGVEEWAAPFSIVVKPADTAHADEFGPRGARTLQIKLDASEAASIVECSPRLARWRWDHHSSAVPAFGRLLAAARRPAPDPGAATIGDAVADVLGALAQAPASHESAEPPRWLRLVRDEIDDTATSGLRLGSLASAAGVHPVYLARQFRRFYNCSVIEYARWRRVQEAARLVAEGGSRLSKVSYDAGFADQSHLCRDFRAAVGMTPGAYRAALERGRRDSG